MIRWQPVKAAAELEIDQAMVFRGSRLEEVKSDLKVLPFISHFESRTFTTVEFK